jgi:hypothetical protein
MQEALAAGVVVSEYGNLSLLAHFGEQTAFMVLASQSRWLPGWPRQRDVYEAYRDLDGDHAELLAELLEFHRARTCGRRSPYLALLLVPLGAFDLPPEYPMLVWGPEYAGYRRSAQFRSYMREKWRLGLLARTRLSAAVPAARGRRFRVRLTRLHRWVLRRM